MTGILLSPLTTLG
uniref:Uncharacterized protein n=1 Tax=Rhizophora mucronata TaxID=61149 RepID=A0A2P2NXA7_RHIMU